MNKWACFIVTKKWGFLGTFLLLSVLAGFFIFRVDINYSLTDYLADDTETKQGLLVMENEFGVTESIQLMLQDWEPADLETLTTAINAIDGVIYASYNPENDVTHEGTEYSLISLNLGRETIDATLYQIETLLGDPDVVFVGSYINTREMEANFSREMAISLTIGVFIFLVILLVTSRAWIEPVLVLVVLGIAVVLNMGTNAIFQEISFITRSVAILLQLALSMDYSIMLLHRYEEKRREGLDSKTASIEALSSSFIPIMASAVTTIAGLAALMFMDFTIGFDIGIVLSKGIFFSALAVFLVLPGLIVLFEKPLAATRKKKSLVLPGGKLASLSLRGRWMLPLGTFVLVVIAFFLNSQNTFLFSDQTIYESQVRYEDVYGYENSLAVLVPYSASAEGFEQQEAFIDALWAADEDDMLLLVGGFTETGATQYLTPGDLVQNYGLTAEMASTILLRAESVGLSDGTSIRGDRLVAFLGTDTSTPKSLSEMADFLSLAENSLSPIFTAMESTTTSVAALLQFIHRIFSLGLSPWQMSVALETPQGEIETLFHRMAVENATVKDVIAFIATHGSELLDNGVDQATIDRSTALNAVLDESLREEVASVLTFLEDLDSVRSSLELAEQMYLGTQYSRIVIYSRYAKENEKTFAFIDEVKTLLDQQFGEDHYITGLSMSTYDISESFDADMKMISIITLLFIFAVVAMSFRSLMIPLMLVMCIQGAVWITMGISAVAHTPVFFMSYVICLCIQMGATIDYAILITSHYNRNRQTMDKGESAKIALTQSLPTIVTSGLILFMGAFLIGIASSYYAISSIGMLLCRGTLLSLLMVLFVLPGLLVVGDKAIDKTSWNLRFKK